MADFLKGLGHDATTVARDYAPALKDSQILAIAHRERRVLIASDRDFGELVFRLGQPHSGVILFRLGSTSLDAKIDRLNYVLSHHSDRLDHFLVLTDRLVRIRE